MKILFVMDPGILVPPKGYGGHERLVEMFAKQYMAMGHEVHLLVTTGSFVEGCTVHPFGKEGFPPKRSDALASIPIAWKFLWKHRSEFDLVHNFGRLAYLLPLFSHPVRKIMTYGREISKINIKFMNFLKGKNIVYTGCSSNLLSRINTTASWETVYNALEFKKYELRQSVTADAPLIFLGRIEKIKGCHTAIKVALETGNKLIIAGNVSPLRDEQLYFKNEIEPFIDGKQIQYVGQLNDEQKNYYLGQSKALIFPIEWNEPFGIVMIEAMACGTPVIAFNKGSVDEVIDEGITGFKVENYNEMLNAIDKIKSIDRQVCRQQAEKRFDVSIIAAQYLGIIDPRRKKILIVTTGQPAANPRVVKEYNAFVQQGYHVKVLYTYSALWSYKIDLKKFTSGKLKKQDFVLVGGNPHTGRFHYVFSRICFKFFSKIAPILSIRFIKEMSMARSTFYLWIVTKRHNADVYIAHYLGALPAASRAAKKNNALLIFDAEDYHRGEADVPYRLKSHAAQTASPKATILFDEAAHARAHERAARIGADGLLVCDARDVPVLATLAEKLAIIVLAKAGSLVPGGGLWLHTQRPEWNDANNALVGNGLSVVTLAHLRRLFVFITRLPGAERAFALSAATLEALQGFNALAAATPEDAVHDAAARRNFLDAAGALLDAWRAESYRGADGRTPAQAPARLLTDLARSLLPLIDATLQVCRRGDGLFHSYNLVDLSRSRAEVSHLYPMLEGQVAMLSCGLLSLAESVTLLDALFASPLFDVRRQSFVLYPDRHLPGFLERNRLDDDALTLPVVQHILRHGRTELLQQQSDGTVRFASGLANRGDLEAAGADLGCALEPLAQAYDRLLKHREFTGRSGTMFAYEGLGCIYWHMVAKLLLAVQERVFEAADRAAPEQPALKAHYRRVRDGLGYRKSAAAYGAFPADAYSHTPAEGGAQQPGMTGQVKEEILTRWGELGLRMHDGRMHFDPVLLDASELARGNTLTFTRARVPYTYRRCTTTWLRFRTESGWHDAPDRCFDPRGVLAVEAGIAFDDDPLLSASRT